MTFEQYLYQNYPTNTPIYVENLNFNNTKKSTIRNLLTRMYKEGKIDRYDAGIYYFPKKNALGKSQLDDLELISDLYIENNGEVYGFPIKATLMEQWGILGQDKGQLHIATNNTSITRIIQVGKKRVHLYKKPYKITIENRPIFTILELTDNLMAFELKTVENSVEKYINEHMITKEDIVENSRFFKRDCLSKMIKAGIWGKLKDRDEIE